MQTLRVEWKRKGSRDYEPSYFYATFKDGAWHFLRQDAMEVRAFPEPSTPELV